MSPSPELLVFATLADLQRATAERLAQGIARAVAERGRCLLAISGGSTPVGSMRALTDPALREGVPWAELSIIWADERFVPFDSPDSNYLLARQHLLDYLPIPSIQVYPVPTYYQSPEEAAAIYDRQVRALIEQHDGAIDIAWLGMGPDGHTASLFPGHPGLAAPPERVAVAIHGSPKPPPTRVTLTLAALNGAREALFQVAGADKAAMVAAALEGAPGVPAGMVRPPAGQVVWMVDAAAAP